MKKPGKIKERQPTDSVEKPPKDKLIVKKEGDKIYKKKTPDFSDPEKRRKFSEQPPTKHNTHN